MMFYKPTFLQRFFALVILPAGMLLGSCSSFNASRDSKTEGFTQMFNGKDLEGWEGDPAYWKIENGVVVGETTTATPPLEENTFLIWKGELKDFELITEFRISAGGNSGINYRNERVAELPFALVGYQADIDGANSYTGQNYEERKRTTIAYRGEKVLLPTSDQGKVENNAWTMRVNNGELGSLDSLKKLIKPEDWNECHLVVRGNRLQHYINGVLMSDVTDEDTNYRALSGLLGLQIHIGAPMKVEYRNFRLKQY